MKEPGFQEKTTTAQKLLLLILLGFSIRLYKALTDVAMTSDGIGYSLSAEKFASGDISGGLHTVFPPPVPGTHITCIAHDQ